MQAVRAVSTRVPFLIRWAEAQGHLKTDRVREAYLPFDRVWASNRGLVIQATYGKFHVPGNLGPITHIFHLYARNHQSGLVEAALGEEDVPDPVPSSQEIPLPESAECGPELMKMMAQGRMDREERMRAAASIFIRTGAMPDKVGIDHIHPFISAERIFLPFFVGSDRYLYAGTSLEQQEDNRKRHFAILELNPDVPVTKERLEEAYRSGLLRGEIISVMKAKRALQPLIKA